MSAPIPKDNRNTGHGHVFARPDGARARCGGPAICPECALDLARKNGEHPKTGASLASNSKLYADRDHYALSPHFERHMLALTGERLESKSAIAAELAHRDAEIERLTRELAHERIARAEAEDYAEDREQHTATVARGGEIIIAERDRLRSALEQFKRAGDPEGTANQRWMYAIASQALSGEPPYQMTASEEASFGKVFARKRVPDETAASQAPIAKVIVREDGPVDVMLYAPGLPPGEHDLYCEPEAVAPMMRDETSGCSWQPIETAPKDGRTLLLGYYNACGKWRTLRGQWFSRAEIDEWENGESCDEGWYETSVEADDIPSCWATEPTHWQPTPRPPLKASARLCGFCGSDPAQGCPRASGECLAENGNGDV